MDDITFKTIECAHAGGMIRMKTVPTVFICDEIACIRPVALPEDGVGYFPPMARSAIHCHRLNSLYYIIYDVRNVPWDAAGNLLRPPSAFETRLYGLREQITQDVLTAREAHEILSGGSGNLRLITLDQN